MPSTSKKQHNFMAAVANSPKFAKKVGVPSAVGKEFLTADKGKTFKQGGLMKKMNPGMMAIMAKRKEMPAKKEMPMKKGGVAKKMASGGMPMVEKDGKKIPAFAADGVGKMKKGGMATKKLARGGGIEIKGKTKGTMIGMKKGGGC